MTNGERSHSQGSLRPPRRRTRRISDRNGLRPGRGRETAARANIIIADTKFEFGTDDRGELVLIDEALTPDSSRFWPVSGYRTGISPPSFDKQFVRDWLETQPWNKKAPAPHLPPDVLEQTSEKYREALRLLTQ